MARNSTRWVFLLIKLAVFALATGFIYFRFRSNKDIEFIGERLGTALADSNNMMLLALCVILMLVNWGTEARKWLLLVDPIERMPYGRALKAVFTGVAVSIFTPNRLGSFLGRILYLKQEDRVMGTVATFYGNLAQLTITAIFGAIGLLLVIAFFPPDTVWLAHWGIWPAAAGSVICVAIYFQPEWIAKLVTRLPPIKNYSRSINSFAQVPAKLKWQVLDLSFRRYLVFTLQLMSLFVVFQPQIPLDQALVLTMLLWLIITFIPTPFLGKLGVRESVALALFGSIANDLAILAASFGLWVINIAIPAIVGGILLLGADLSRRK